MKNKTVSKDSVIKVLLRKDLKEELDSLENRIDKKLDIKLNKFKKEIDENAKKYRDVVLNKLDEVMGELQDRREERTIETHQYSEIVVKVNDHEKRIKTLEQTAQPA